MPALLEAGHTVRALVRSLDRASHLKALGVQCIEGDIFNPVSLPLAVEQAEVVLYLVHSMGSGEGAFAELDRKAADNVGAAAKTAGVKQIIYLGGLGKRENNPSIHLRSRHETGNHLRKSGVPITELRAAIVVGSGSVSFEMIHHLVNRLPVMVCPRWVVTNTQPIATQDVVRYLTESILNPEVVGRSLDIGGPDVLPYRDMMLVCAKVLRLKRYLLQVPVLTPRLSSYWVNLVTPIPAGIARPLIEGLRIDTVCENDDARRIFKFEPIGFEKAVRIALKNVSPEGAPEDHQLLLTDTALDHIESSHLLEDRREAETSGSPADLWQVVISLGGETGWLYADWLWQLRGKIDEWLGGSGLRKGRRLSEPVRVGDTIDWWRIEVLEPRRRLLLHAELSVRGQAWLEFKVEPEADGTARLIQTAHYYPRGLIGILYWLATAPFHFFVFRGMARAICKRADRLAASETSTPDT